MYYVGPVCSLEIGVGYILSHQLNAKRREIANQLECIWLQVQRTHFQVAYVIRKMHRVI